MPLDAVLTTFSATPGLTPAYEPEKAAIHHINLPPSVTLAKGTVLGLAAAGLTNDVQTFTQSGGPGSGTQTYTWVIDGVTYTTGALDYAATGATAQTALRLSMGGAHVTITGGASGPYVVTFLGKFAGRPIPIGTSANTFNTGSITAAHTTTGVAAGTYSTFSGAVIAAPTVAPTLTAAGSDGTFLAGSPIVTYTWANALGETTPSPGQEVTITAAQDITVTSITGAPTGATIANFYVDSIFSKAVTLSAGATGTVVLTDVDTAAGTTSPNVNTAYTATSGYQTAKCILQYDAASDTDGKITLGGASTGGNFGQKYDSCPAYFSGTFRTSQITGLTAKAVTDLVGKLISGTTTAGLLKF